MKTIYRIYDTHQGKIQWCLKKDFSVVFNSMSAALKVVRMDEIALSPKDVKLDELQALMDFCSDNIEIETLENEEELIELLNGMI